MFHYNLFQVLCKERIGGPWDHKCGCCPFLTEPCCLIYFQDFSPLVNRTIQWSTCLSEVLHVIKIPCQASSCHYLPYCLAVAGPHHPYHELRVVGVAEVLEVLEVQWMLEMGKRLASLVDGREEEWASVEIEGCLRLE